VINYIIDSSIVLRSLLLPDSRVAKRLKRIDGEVEHGEAKIYAPQLLVTEVANGLRFSETSVDKAQGILRDFFDFELTYFELSNVNILGILNLSYELGTTVYDTTYHYLAMMLEGRFITCDKAYHKAAKHLGNIELLD